MSHIVIIGNGIAGITAARHIRKHSDYEITVIGSETEYFFSRTALMYIYMGHMKFENTKPYEDWFWSKNKIELVHRHVDSIDFEKRCLDYRGGGRIEYDSLILATGSEPNTFGWPGQDLDGVQGLYSYQDLQLMEDNTANITEAVIVGGGLIGVEMAEMLHTRDIEVTFLIRESHFWGNVLPKPEGDLITRHLKDHGIKLNFNTELAEILSDQNKRAKAIIDSKGSEIECQFVGLTTGVKPNIEFLRNSDLECDRGILVDENLRTNLEGVYAIGDCAQHRVPPEGRSNIEQVWYTGRMMGEAVAKTITGNTQKYSPGPWFNSAKFFDIEYQTYGIVKPELLPDQSELYWEDKSGTRCAHFVWHRQSGKLEGFNSMGIRWRHEVFDHWLRNGTTMEQVMNNLESANFDPEFFQRFEGQMKEAFKTSVTQ